MARPALEMRLGLALKQKTKLGILEGFEIRAGETWYLILGELGLFWAPERRVVAEG